MEYKTITGTRPDLASIEVNPVQGYIGSLIYPVVNTMEKTGTVYYKTLTADSAAQTGRSSGTAPTATLLTDSSTTFSCAEVIKRYGVDRAEVKQMGGIEACDKLGGMAAKRSVMRAMETAQAAALFTSGRYSAAPDIGSAIIDGIIGKADALSRYPGKLAFVCSTTFYRALISETEIKNLMGRFVPAGLGAQDILSLTKNAFLNMLQTIFAFDMVLIGDDDHWKVATREDSAAIVKLPDPAEFSHKLDPVLGKTMLYLPDGVQQFDLESFFNEDTKINNYDATSWYQVKELNAAAALLVKGIGTATT